MKNNSVWLYLFQISMDSYENNTLYDLKFVDAVKHVKKYKCCPNDTFPKIDYTFMLTQHHAINHKTVITPAIGRQFLKSKIVKYT